MTNRPTDWSPLSDGDPCPGNPVAWGPVIEFWRQRSNDIDAFRQQLHKNMPIKGEGHRIRQLERALADGVSITSLVSSEFEKAAQTAQDWQRKLESMQLRAEDALHKAQAAHQVAHDLQIKIASLQREIDFDDFSDLMTWIKVNGFWGNGGLKGELANAQAEIAAAQKVVDDIRDEYARESVATQNEYSIANVGSLYPASGVLNGVLLNDEYDVYAGVHEYDPEALSLAFSKAQSNPECVPELLNMLSTLSAAQIKEFFLARPYYALYALNPMGGDTVRRAQDVQKWWNAELSFSESGKYLSSHDEQGAGYGLLSEEQRQALMLYAPGLVGNMQGIDYSHRSQANENLLRLLSSDPADRKGLPYTLNVDVAPHIAKTAYRLLDKQSKLQNEFVDIDIQIVTMDLSTITGDSDSWNDIKAAVSIGNLDSAGNVSYLVHGINNNPETTSDNYIDGVKGLYQQARHSGVSNHATVAWMNYEAPKAPPDFGVWSNEKTHEGGHRLTQDLDTLNTVRGGQDNIRLNVVGHSYGTSVVFSALTEMKTTADSATLLASAGLDKDQVAAVNSGKISLALADNPNSPGAKNIYYTDTWKDWIYRLGQLPASKVDPSSLTGATRFTSGVDPAGVYEDVDGHNFFIPEGSNRQGFLSNTTARRDLAYIIGGMENKITREPPLFART